MSVADIALDWGFNDLSTFYRLFKRLLVWHLIILKKHCWFSRQKHDVVMRPYFVHSFMSRRVNTCIRASVLPTLSGILLTSSFAPSGGISQNRNSNLPSCGARLMGL